MLNQVTFEDVEAIAIGAGILGTGGGGNPYLGRLQLQQLIAKKGPPAIADPMALDDDALVVVVGGIGAPTVSVEKLPQGTEMWRAIQRLEAHLGQRFDAIAIAEIGGSNAMRPLIAGVQAGLPTVDADGMGRAFPELQMTSYLFGEEISVTPLALVDAGADAAVIPRAASHVWAERLARNITISMGGRAGLAGFVMRGAHLKATGIHYTLTLAHHLGQTVLRARRNGDNVPETVATTLGGRVMFRGKIIDVDRRTTKGFARGSVLIESFDARGKDLRIDFQNEFLIADCGGDILVTVPDSICMVTIEYGHPVTTELLRYGTRVAVLGVPAATAMKTPAALEVVGPRAFGYEIDFQPLPGGRIGVAPPVQQTG